MPELPEVEIIRRDLKNLIGATILDSKCIRTDLRIPIPRNISEQISMSKVLKISRRAKYLLINMSNNQTIIFHLGMSGKLWNMDYDSPITKHTHFILYFDNQISLHFNDPRRFGLITICRTHELQDHILFKHLGPEPFSDNFSANYLVTKLSKSKRPIKLSLMDNNIVVGIGNIYASEILFRSSILPTRASNSLGYEDMANIIINTREVLQEAIIRGGSSIRDYQKTSGEKGGFQEYFSVYGKDTKECKTCSNIIQKVNLGGRVTYFCQKCQN